MSSRHCGDGRPRHPHLLRVNPGTQAQTARKLPYSSPVRLNARSEQRDPGVRDGQAEALAHGAATDQTGRDACRGRGALSVFRVVVASLVVASMLGSCSDADPQNRLAEPRTSSSLGRPDGSSEPPPTALPVPAADRPVAGTHAAIEVLPRPDIRPEGAYLSENGNLLVWWELTGIRDRDAFGCRYPVAVTWVPRRGWSGGVSTGAVHAWLLADGMREVLPTRTGFYVSHSECSGREFRDQAPGLVVDDRGRIRTARAASATEGPREGATSVPCGPPTRGSCQVDPETGRVFRLPGPLSWIGSWREQASILWRASSHISGTWSVDGGTTWNQFIDPWDASPLRRGGTTFAASNGVRSSFGELTGGSFREGFVEWAPGDAAPMAPLPKSVDGYRSWQTTPDGTLVGIGRGGVYVSEGSNWYDVTRRDMRPCGGGALLVGRYLVCGPQRLKKGPRTALGLHVSDDLGVTWSTILLDSVVPRTADRRR